MKYEVKKYFLDGENKGWAILEGYSKYAVSQDGRVINLNTNRLLKPQLTYNGYNRVSLSSDCNKIRHLRVGVMVASAFVSGYEEGFQVDHKDRLKTNDDFGNLRWVTQKENLENRASLIAKRLLNSYLEGRISKELLQKRVKECGVDKEFNEKLNRLNFLVL